MLDVLLLWHLHQPYYVDPLTRTALMPWVRLHSVKGYMDMIEMSGRCPGVRLNFNFAPVLVQQLLELQRREVKDLWETWSRAPAAALGFAEKRGILENFFKINRATCVDPHPRYAQLLDLRGRQVTEPALIEAVARFTEQDFRDLQTWYNLAWCGFSVCRRYPELPRLKAKGRDFTEEEKNRVLDIHQEVIGSVLEFYRAAQDEGRVEITTTPFFHPIMPLVYDTDFAARCMPGRELPPRFTAPEDVRQQLLLAQELHQQVFGRKARGLWPSEGAVAPELAPLFAEAGIEYFCTDEEVLFRSLKLDPAHAARPPDRLALFQGWDFTVGGARVKGLFRERPLSDFLGFSAARNPARDAAAHLVTHLENIADAVRHPNGAVLIALDGENPWEAFADGGEKFLTVFYEALSASAKLRTRRLGDYFDAARDLPAARHLHTGSWINGDFDIWIGDREENRAWEWLGQTREFLQSAEAGLGADARRRAWREIYAAEGSDWFWWYGPDFQNDSDFLFDALFRKHLQNVYILAKTTVPQHLDVPIRQRGLPPTFTPPTRYINPQIDGGASGYFDWYGAGHLDMDMQQTAMFQSGRVSKAIYFGFNERSFFVRYEYANKAPAHIVLDFCKPAHRRLVLKRAPAAGGDYHAEIETSKDGATYHPTGATFIVRHKSRIECEVPLTVLGVPGDGAPMAFFIQILDQGIGIEQCPERGLIEFNGPSAEFGLRNWFV
ncbi:MAG: alpha-amylase [Verrucomicrobiales bacterium]|jgi:alpha-amylase/alpha-mannosidase (GH57 family)|nr:alpha-amylase [Verrucomicrobiales bacterium]